MIDWQKIAPKLRLGEDGIWRAERAAAISYPESGNETSYMVEDASFWFQHRNRCITALIQRFEPAGEGPILDIGGGNGCVAQAIQQSGRAVALLEPGPAGVRNARRRGVAHVIHATLEEAGFRAGALPAAGLFDVLEHIEDDVAFLRSVREILAPGGRLYLTVPAYPMLWSDDDVIAGHYRRYTAETLAAALNAAGFHVDFQTQIFRFLPPAIFLMRTIPSRLKGAHEPKLEGIEQKISREHTPRRGVAQKALDRVMAVEVRNILESKPMRFGGSCLAAASR